MEAEEPGEGAKEVPGEGVVLEPLAQILAEEVIVDKILTFEDASRCLNTLGKDESGIRYAYLMITATDSYFKNKWEIPSAHMPRPLASGSAIYRWIVIQNPTKIENRIQRKWRISIILQLKRKLTNISMILNFKHVLFVDVSGNLLNLESLQVLVEMPYMILLKAKRNRVESPVLSPMPYLQVLSLSKNLILETGNIYQPMLESLDLNYNQIYTAKFDEERLPELKQLEMRGNYFPDISGSYPATLEHLFLAENRISTIIPSDISKLVNLKILHLRDNYIRKLNGFTETLVNLTYLNLRQNKINKFRQFRKLKCLPRLQTLIVMQNPVAGDAEEKAPGEGADEEEVDEEAEKEDITRIPLLVLLPNLKRINKVPVTLEEREEVAEVREEKYEEIMAEDSSEDETEAATMTDVTTGYTTDTDGGEESTVDEVKEGP